MTELPSGYIPVLDHGYVGLVDSMGTDLSATAAARVSYDKNVHEWNAKEARLLAFLAKEEHTSVFRHSTLSFEVYAPFMVARQWWKYAVASSHVEDQLGWNESSRRYITEEPTFYIPAYNQWRSKPENSKQGSGPVLEDSVGNFLTADLKMYVDKGVQLYDEAMEAGAAPEQARLFLPAYGMYVRWRWTASLGAVTHFLQQRLEHDAQKEIFDFAVVVKDLAATKFPHTVESLLAK